MLNSDLEVQQRSRALEDFELDVLVSGSIGAVESVRFIRCLRRIGANVHPWLTKGAEELINPKALSWAAGGNPVRKSFSGEASHIAQADALVISPCTANLLGKIANGITDSPGSALCASYLGQKKPVILVPNMHQSLFDSPFIQKNKKKLENHVFFAESRIEEGKFKFPEPAYLANYVSHIVNKKNASKSVLITMGSTKAYLDAVRYVSNYSSGKLGSLMSEELYRLGHETHVIKGDCKHQPINYSRLYLCDTNLSMENTARTILEKRVDSAAILAASVLDFEPVEIFPGKIKSSQHDSLQISMKKTSKIIAGLNPQSRIKVGFKLETDLNVATAKKLAKKYIDLYQLSLFVVNDLAAVSESKHEALIFSPKSQDSINNPTMINTKLELAHAISRHVSQGLSKY